MSRTAEDQAIRQLCLVIAIGEIRDKISRIDSEIANHREFIFYRENFPLRSRGIARARNSAVFPGVADEISELHAEREKALVELSAAIDTQRAEPVVNPEPADPMADHVQPREFPEWTELATAWQTARYTRWLNRGKLAAADQVGIFSGIWRLAYDSCNIIPPNADSLTAWAGNPPHWYGCPHETRFNELYLAAKLRVGLTAEQFANAILRQKTKKSAKAQTTVARAVTSGESQMQHIQTSTREQPVTCATVLPPTTALPARILLDAATSAVSLAVASARSPAGSPKSPSKRRKPLAPKPIPELPATSLGW